jgi:hypothetical protein
MWMIADFLSHTSRKATLVARQVPPHLSPLKARKHKMLQLVVYSAGIDCASLKEGILFVSAQM